MAEELYKLSGASDAACWIMGQLVATTLAADKGITAEKFQSLVNQCPHGAPRDDEAQMIFGTANYPACQEDIKSLHIHQQHGQDQGVIARTVDEPGAEPWQAPVE